MASRRRPGGRFGRWIGVLVEGLAWTLLTWGIWLLSLSAVDDQDLLVGGLSGVVCGVAATAVRRAIGARWRPQPRLAVPALLLPWSIVADAVAVLASPLRSPGRGARVERIDIGAAGRSSIASARRAVATAVVSASPATVVLDVDDESGILTVHAMPSRGPKLYERYARR